MFETMLMFYIFQKKERKINRIHKNRMQTKTNDLTCISSKQHNRGGMAANTAFRLRVLRLQTEPNAVVLKHFGLGTPCTLKSH